MSKSKVLPDGLVRNCRKFKEENNKSIESSFIGVSNVENVAAGSFFSPKSRFSNFKSVSTISD
jgi:hypothetical protein